MRVEEDTPFPPGQARYCCFQQVVLQRSVFQWVGTRAEEDIQTLQDWVGTRAEEDTPTLQDWVGTRAEEDTPFPLGQARYCCFQQVVLQRSVFQWVGTRAEEDIQMLPAVRHPPRLMPRSQGRLSTHRSGSAHE